MTEGPRWTEVAWFWAVLLGRLTLVVFALWLAVQLVTEGIN